MVLIDPGTVSAFATLLTPLTGMAIAVFTLMARRNKKLEAQRDNLVRYVLTTCTEKSEGMEKLAALISESGKGE